MSTSKPVLFASDVHLCVSRPDVSQRFLDFLNGPAMQASQLWLLGDLFEYWPGDDSLDQPLHRDVIQALHQLHVAGVACHFIAGNRDFLIGEAFCRTSACQWVSEPHVIELGGKRTLLMHGDLLCTDDTAYQAFRQQVRGADWQNKFLSQPLAQRIEQIEALRRQSESAKQTKMADIMDVNTEAVLQALQQHGCTRLIHGHTHRPAVHYLQLGNKTAERWVLPAWDLAASDSENPAKIGSGNWQHGGYLACFPNHCGTDQMRWYAV